MRGRDRDLSHCLASPMIRGSRIRTQAMTAVRVVTTWMRLRFEIGLVDLDTVSNHQHSNKPRLKPSCGNTESGHSSRRKPWFSRSPIPIHRIRGPMGQAHGNRSAVTGQRSRTVGMIISCNREVLHHHVGCGDVDIIWRSERNNVTRQLPP